MHQMQRSQHRERSVDFFHAGLDAVNAKRPFHGRGISSTVHWGGCQRHGILHSVRGLAWRGAGTDALHAGHPFFLARSHKQDPGEGFVQVT